MKKVLKSFGLILFIVIGFIHRSNATHIVGGELYYDCLGANTYQLTLKLYRDCSAGTAGFDDPAYLSFWDREFTPNNLDTSAVSFPGSIVLPFTALDTCYIPSGNICLEEALYITTVTLPASISGYVFVYQRCCRNPSILNIVDPGAQGTTFFEAVPSSALCNNSPRFNNFPANYLCVGQPFQFNSSATDADGDSLVYSICSAHNGAEFGLTQPIVSAPPPYYSLPYNSPFTALDPISGVAPLAIHPVTGLLTITPSQIGRYVIGVCCDEYKAGVLIGTHSRDFELHVVPCTQEPDCISTVNVQTQNLLLNIEIYPNPSNDVVNIKAGTEMNVIVFDMLGKQVYCSLIPSLQQTISIVEWNSGIYTYRVFANGEFRTGKFIKN